MSIPKNHQTVLEFAEKGTINDGILEMPTLWSLDKNENYRYWNLNIGIENSATGDKIDVTPEFIDRKKLPSNAVGIYWTESGIENTKNPIISEKTYVSKGKNIGNKNYTTPFTQSILDANSDYNLKIRKGHVLDKNLLNPLNQIISFDQLMMQIHRGEKPWRVFAMALHDVNKSNNWRHIIYPCKIQPKLDGTMFIVVYHPKLPEIELKISDDNESKKINVTMDSYSRGREAYEGQDHILWGLYPVLKKYPGLHITGELWKKGYGLQDISGSSRRQLDSKIKTDAIKLDFNIFDCFYIDHPEQPFEEREAIIGDVMLDLDDSNSNKKYIKQIPSYEIENKNKLLETYQKFLEDGMEGGVIRNLNSLYEVGIDKERRSYTTLKIKPRPDAEWPVFSFKEGNGKETGAVIWICTENDEGLKQRLNIPEDEPLPPLSDRKKFSVTPNMDYETRYKIFNKLTEDSRFFEQKIMGQLLTINYSILSKDFLPQQPKVLRFRDPSIQNLIINL